MQTDTYHKLIRNIALQADIETDENAIVNISSEEEALHALAKIITHLIDTNFEKLLWILYRIDVNEAKLKKVLKENSPADAPDIIAQMIIERERQKEQFKATNNKNKNPENEDELKW